MRSKGAVLVIVWSLLCSTASILNVKVMFRLSVFEIINGVVTAVLFLFTGWLADVYFGRYKVLYKGLHLDRVVGECWWQSVASDSQLVFS